MILIVEVGDREPDGLRRLRPMDRRELLDRGVRMAGGSAATGDADALAVMLAEGAGVWLTHYEFDHDSH